MGILEAVDIEIYRLRKAKPDNEFLLFNKLENKIDYYSINRVKSFLVAEIKKKELNIYKLYREVYAIDDRVKLRPQEVLDRIIEDETVIIDNIGFKPIHEKIYYDENNNSYFNTWKQPDLFDPANFQNLNFNFEDLKEKAPAIMRLLNNLHSNNQEAIKDTLLKIADKIKYPYEKGGDCIVFYPAEAAGKGILYKFILQPIFTQYSKKILMSKLKNDFNAFLSQTLVLVLEEGKRDQELVEVLKELITEPTLLINEKGKNQRMEDIYFLVFLFSNHMNPADLGKRRGSYHQCRSLGSDYEESQQIGAELCRLIPGELKYLVHYLLSLEFEHNEALKPFTTKAKNSVNDLNKTPLELFFDYLSGFPTIEPAFKKLAERQGYDHLLGYIEINTYKGMPYIAKDSFRKAYNNFCQLEGLKNNLILHNKDIVQLWAIMGLEEHHHKRIDVTIGVNEGRRLDHVDLVAVNSAIQKKYKEMMKND